MHTLAEAGGKGMALGMQDWNSGEVLVEAGRHLECWGRWYWLSVIS